MSVADPLFSFKCDIDGRFAHVRIYRGRVTWQRARVSSRARLLILFVPLAILVGVGLGLLASWTFRESVHGTLNILLGVAVGVILGLAFGYRLGALLGDTVFPTRSSTEESIPLVSKTVVTPRSVGRAYSLIRIQNAGQSVELRVAPGYVDMLTGRLRAGRA